MCFNKPKVLDRLNLNNNFSFLSDIWIKRPMVSGIIEKSI